MRYFSLIQNAFVIHDHQYQLLLMLAFLRYVQGNISQTVAYCYCTLQDLKAVRYFSLNNAAFVSHDHHYLLLLMSNMYAAKYLVGIYLLVGSQIFQHNLQCLLLSAIMTIFGPFYLEKCSNMKIRFKLLHENLIFTAITAATKICYQF